MKTIFRTLIFGVIAMVCFSSCGVYYTTTTASIDWKDNNGNNVAHWDDAVLDVTYSNDMGTEIKASTNGFMKSTINNGLGFINANGEREYISGGLIHVYNVGKEKTEAGIGRNSEALDPKDVSSNKKVSPNIADRFVFSDRIYYQDIKGTMHDLGTNYNDAYWELIRLRDNEIISQDVVNVFRQMKRVHKKETGNNNIK